MTKRVRDISREQKPNTHLVFACMTNKNCFALQSKIYDKRSE